MTQQQKLTEQWKSEIGTAENPLGSNHIKYVTEYLGYTPAEPWPPYCMMAQWYCFREAGLSDLFMGGGKTASCTALYDWALAHGQWVTGNYQEGDVFIFAKPLNRAGIEHTGYYTGDRSGGRYVCIEANNTSVVSYVYRSDSEILGAFRAPWTSEDTPAIRQSIIGLPILRFGDRGYAVETMQRQLLQYAGAEKVEIDLGPTGCDGEFGAYTQAAVIAVQAYAGIEPDGECGPQTWAVIMLKLKY